MKKLYNYINELHQEQWDYYWDIEQNVIPKPFSNEISHQDFIKKYFKRGGKEIILKKFFKVEKSILAHGPHTNSIFFLGLIIYYNSKSKDLIFTKCNPPGYKLFPFLWFLTSSFLKYLP